MYRPVSPLAFATASDTFQFRFGTAQPGKTTGAFTLDKRAQCFLEQGAAILNTGEYCARLRRVSSSVTVVRMVVTPENYAPIIASFDAIIDAQVEPAWLLL
jgi:hypothetical protein